MIFTTLYKNLIDLNAIHAKLWAMYAKSTSYQLHKTACDEELMRNYIHIYLHEKTDCVF